MDKPHKKFLREWFDQHDAGQQVLIARKRRMLNLPVNDNFNVKKVEKIKAKAQEKFKALNLFPWHHAFNFNVKDVVKQAANANKPVKGVFKDCHSYTSFLTKRGFIKLGGGAYSHVVGHPSSDKVLKICRRPQDDGWVDYVKWAANQGFAGKCAPKMYSYKWYAEGQFGVAVMERLAKTISHVGAEHDARCIQELMELSRRNKMARDLLSIAAPGVETFRSQMMETFKGAGWDMHGGNMMIREDGSFVVTDPICGWDSKFYDKRLKAGDFAPSVPALAA